MSAIAMRACVCGSAVVEAWLNEYVFCRLAEIEFFHHGEKRRMYPQYKHYVTFLRGM